MLHRTRAVTDFLALAAVMVWPVIPVFWIPVHGFPRLFRLLGKLTYIVPAVLWPPLAYLIFSNRGLLLHYRVNLSLPVRVAGVILLAAGIALQIRSGALLSLRGLIGIPEISSGTQRGLAKEGIYSAVRHPTYLSHTMMLSGMFLFTAVAAVGIVALLDFIVINTLVIPLEERELVARFGKDYIQYREKVPRYFPKILRR